jgi:hypothetical protein
MPTAIIYLNGNHLPRTAERVLKQNPPCSLKAKREDKERRRKKIIREYLQILGKQVRSRSTKTNGRCRRRRLDILTDGKHRCIDPLKVTDWLL